MGENPGAKNRPGSFLSRIRLLLGTYGSKKEMGSVFQLPISFFVLIGDYIDDTITLERDLLYRFCLPAHGLDIIQFELNIIETSAYEYTLNRSIHIDHIVVDI